LSANFGAEGGTAEVEPGREKLNDSVLAFLAASLTASDGSGEPAGRSKVKNGRAALVMLSAESFGERKMAAGSRRVGAGRAGARAAGVGAAAGADVATGEVAGRPRPMEGMWRGVNAGAAGAEVLLDRMSSTEGADAVCLGLGAGVDLTVDVDRLSTGRGLNGTRSGTAATGFGTALGGGAVTVDARRLAPGFSTVGSGERDGERRESYPLISSRVVSLRLDVPTFTSFSAAPRDADPR
jgi:hypothetical protein